MRMAHDAGDQLGGGQHGVHCQADEGGAQAAFEPVVRHSLTYRPGIEK